MKGINTKRILSFVIAVIISFVMIFSIYFVITHAAHDCSGVDCSVCYAIEISRETAKLLISALVVTAFAICLFKELLSGICTDSIITSFLSLFHLKVRLNN